MDERPKAEKIDRSKEKAVVEALRQLLTTTNEEQILPALRKLQESDYDGVLTQRILEKLLAKTAGMPQSVLRDLAVSGGVRESHRNANRLATMMDELQKKYQKTAKEYILLERYKNVLMQILILTTEQITAITYNFYNLLNGNQN